VSIAGIGIDIVEIERIEALIQRHGERFLARVFTREERDYCGAHRRSAISFAARFAAKEAVSKAFGTGICARVGWLDISVQRDTSGKPSVRLENGASDFARELGVTRILISLSHSQNYAVAQAIALRDAG